LEFILLELSQMPANKKNTKRKHKKHHENKNDITEIPVLTRRAPVEASVTPPVENLEKTDHGPDHEIRAIVTLAVNESVPKIVDNILTHLKQSGEIRSDSDPDS